MSQISSDQLFDDLALATKTSKILSGLIANYCQLQIDSKIIPIATVASQDFLAQQGLYVSSIIYLVTNSKSFLKINAALETLAFDFTNNESEQPFVHIRAQINSKQITLGNRQKWGELLIAQLTNSSSKNELANWNIWTDDRGYLYFQPTNEALCAWLKMLFYSSGDRADSAVQEARFSTASASNDLLKYIELRCNQILKLATSPINPWVQGQLHCTQAAELELIYGVIQVYDSLYMGVNYKIVAASKSLVEKFLEFDRSCRLLDLAANSPAFHERAGLIAIVRSAVRDLLASPALIARAQNAGNSLKPMP